MASSSTHASILSEKDIPGASLDGRKPENLKIAELKFWLACREAPLKGKKADNSSVFCTIIYWHPAVYFCRVNAYIKYGLDKDVCNPYGGATPTDPSGSASVGTTPRPSYPEQGWIAITSAFHTTMEVPKFNDAHIIAYFVTRTVADGLPASDLTRVKISFFMVMFKPYRWAGLMSTSV